MQFSSFVNIEPSATIAINTLAQAKKAAGERVFNLSAGEPMLPPDSAVVAGAVAALEAGKTLYPPAAGIPELRSAFVEWLNTSYGTYFAKEESLVTCGGKFGIFAVCQALLNPGDEALAIAPYWVSYPEIVKLFGGRPMIVPTSAEHNWKVSVADLETAVTKKTKLFIINNAANPTGVLYTRAELAELLAFAAKHDLIVVADEVYSGLVYDSSTFVSCGSFPEHKERVVVIQSCSKHFAMTGWRVGFALGPVELIKKVTMLQTQSTTGTSSIAQWAALAAVQSAEKIIPAVRSAMQERRDVLVKGLREIFGANVIAPAAGLYAFVALADLGAQEKNSKVFCEQALQQGNVALVPGAAFGQEGYVRLSFGDKSEELLAALQALHQFINR